MLEEHKPCYDCGKKIYLDAQKGVIDGFLLEYDTPDGKVQIFKCKPCYKKDTGLHDFQKCEVYSRVVGYIRPVQQWNLGKQEEYNQRKNYKL